ncbi:MAG TPA: ATP-binding protein [Alphaproteobacteria bacterium]|nr:ATP-binding protein [Alphaproteobacteria bacterium]
MPALRLKTKLVFAITAMVVAIVATISTLYISEVVHQGVQEAYNDSQFIAREILDMGGKALEVDITNTKVDLNDSRQVELAVEEILQTDSGVNALLESVLGYSPTIYDAAIVTTHGRALLHTTQSLLGKEVPRRDDFSSVVTGGIRKQFRIIYGPSQVYDVRVPLARNGIPFGEVRVGVSTVLLKSQLQPLISRALFLSGGSVLICLILSAVLSTVALRPLAAINRRLDLLTAGQVDGAEPPARRTDEYGAVSTKIERLGKQMRDVKEVFSALKENLDQMMANLQDGVMLFTSDFRAVLVSASAERFVGRPRGEMLGQHPSEIFSPDTRLGDTILQALATHRALVQEEISTEQGSHIQIDLDFIEERGERIGALLTLRDAESVHRIEDEIELSRRLAAIGRLTSGVAHEVKNPINAIVVHLEVLKQKLNITEPDARRHIDVITSEIKRLDRVVQTLVDFTRPVELHLTDLDLRKVVEEVVALATPEAAQKSVQILRAICPEPLPVRVDVDLVKQAILNIVINGVQAMPQGGSLNVTVRRENDGAVVKVRDQGQGIPPEVRDKIFNLYFTTKKGGSGIGLAMTYRVVQLHHGSVEFDSMEGSGTSFYLRFPLVDSAAAVEQTRPASETPVKTA